MKRWLLVPAVLSLSNAVLASSLNDAALTKSVRETERIVNSLYMAKPAQARVYAADGTEYTCSEALWLKAHIHAATQALAGNDASTASRELHVVVAMLKSHGVAINS